MWYMHWWQQSWVTVLKWNEQWPAVVSGNVYSIWKWGAVEYCIYTVVDTKWRDASVNAQSLWLCYLQNGSTSLCGQFVIRNDMCGPLTTSRDEGLLVLALYPCVGPLVPHPHALVCHSIRWDTECWVVELSWLQPPLPPPHVAGASVTLIGLIHAHGWTP